MHSTRSILLLAPATLLLTACDATAPKTLQRVNLSTTIESARSSQSAPALDVIVSGTGGTVRITSAQLMVSHIKLASNTTCSAEADDDARVGGRHHVDRVEEIPGGRAVWKRALIFSRALGAAAGRTDIRRLQRLGVPGHRTTVARHMEADGELAAGERLLIAGEPQRDQVAPD